MKKHTIIGISGTQGSGKSTLAAALVAHYSGLHMKFAKVLYDLHEAIRKVMKSYDYEMMPKDGRLLQLLGTEWGRNTLGQNIWVDLTKRAILSAVEQVEKWDKAFIVVDDTRFENELEMFHALKKEYPDWKIVTIRLEADEDTRRARAEGWRSDTNHPSETGLNHRVSEFDLLIDTARTSKEHVFDIVRREIEAN